MRKRWDSFFCDDSAQRIVDMLVAECDKGGVTMRLRSEVLSVERDESGFILALNGETVTTQKLVIASGGLSMPGLGASPFGYKIAEQFGLKVLPTRAGLVPFTLHKPLLEQLQTLSGVSVPCVITRPPMVRYFGKTYFLPIVGCPAPPFYRFPATGNRAS
ncbi:membrane protein [Salmonella enterica subsp. enterica]|uniref:Membrane protein n=1 Tax=Salmonella enterica I TaxID=59201 RepID=A0A447N2B0_SALET|nr:membrane protein [Salmonella enterica subsp. enterica]